MSLHGVLRDIVPSGAASAVEAVTTADGLWPVEERWVEHAVPTRRAQFAAGRRAARGALLALGVPAAPIGRGDRGEPLWPAGLSGSISHTDAIAAAIVAPRADRSTVGLDLEVVGGPEPSVWDVVFTPAERGVLDIDGRFATVAFSAKEAAFKALYPATGADLDYLDAEATVQLAGTALVTVAAQSIVIGVVWRQVGDLVVTVATFER